jgi:hypothetical protein
MLTKIMVQSLVNFSSRLHAASGTNQQIRERRGKMAERETHLAAVRAVLAAAGGDGP